MRRTGGLEVESPDRTGKAQASDLIQLHLTLPYKMEPRAHPRIREQLQRGLRILQLQRISDREVIVTLGGEPG
jgi:hypothetical protein